MLFESVDVLWLWRVKQAAFSQSHQHMLPALDRLLEEYESFALLLAGALVPQLLHWTRDQVSLLRARAQVTHEFTEQYLRWLIHEHYWLKGESGSVPLEQVYQPPLLKRASNVIGFPAGDHANRRAIPPSLHTYKIREAIEAFDRVLLLGELGSGKSLTVSKIVVEHAYASLYYTGPLHPDGAADVSRLGSQRPFFPIVVPLKRLRAIPPPPIEELHRYCVSLHALHDLPPQYLETRLKRGRCIVLFDGLDELGTASKVVVVANWICGLAATFPGGNRFWVTARGNVPVGELGGFVHLRLEPFGLHSVEGFIRDWFDSLEGNMATNRAQLPAPFHWLNELVEFSRPDRVEAGISNGNAHELLASLSANDATLALARSPLALSHLVDQFVRDGSVNHSRYLGMLFRTLAGDWEESKGIHLTCPYAARHAFLHQAGLQMLLLHRPLSRKELLSVAQRVFESMEFRGAVAGEVIDELAQRSILLHAEAEDRYSIQPQSLVAYCAALALQGSESALHVLQEHFDDPEWRPAIIRFAALQRDTGRLISATLHGDFGPGVMRLLLAADCLAANPDGAAGEMRQAVGHRLIEVGWDTLDSQLFARVWLLLKELGDEFAGDFLLLKLASSDAETRFKALRAAFFLRDARLTGVLAELLLDADPRIQSLAARALGKTASPDALKGLEENQLLGRRIPAGAARAIAQSHGRLDPDLY